MTGPRRTLHPMPKVVDERPETQAELFERLCLTLEMAAGLPHDEAYRLLREVGKGLKARSKLARWYLAGALVILGDTDGADDLVGAKR